MSTTLRGPAGVVEVLWWWEAPRIGRCLLFRDQPHARSYIDGLRGRAGNLVAMRRFVTERLSTPSTRLDDAALLDELSWWLVRGKLRIAAEIPEPRPIARSKIRDDAGPPIPTRAYIPPTVVEPEVVEEEPTFIEDVDAAALAQAKREAAELGVPFCEECMKKKAPVPEPEPDTFSEDVDAAASAEVLKQAAKKGTPFCEECEKAKAKAKAAEQKPAAPVQAKQPAPAPEPPRGPLPEREPVAPTFAENVDAAESAATMKLAAKNGAPFCEECMKAQQKAGGGPKT